MKKKRGFFLIELKYMYMCSVSGYSVSVLKKLQIIPQWEGSPESANK